MPKEREGGSPEATEAPGEAIALSFLPPAFPEALLSRSQASLKEGRLLPCWLYQSPAQARRWLHYAQAFSPHGHAPLQELHRQAFLAFLPDHAFSLVSLGCGDGAKERQCLDLLLSRGEPARGARESGEGRKEADLESRLEGRLKRCVLIDFSAPLLLRACLNLRQILPAARIFPKVTDLGAPFPPAEKIFPQDVPLRVLALGISPNMDLPDLLLRLRGQLGYQDRVLLSLNLGEGEAVLRQYDNPLARDWFLGALRELGLWPLAEELRIFARTPAKTRGEGKSSAGKGNSGGEKNCESGVLWELRAEARLPPGAVASPFGPGFLPRWETLEVFFSRRYAPGAMGACFARGGFRLERIWEMTFPGEAGGEALCLLAPEAGAWPEPR